MSRQNHSPERNSLFRTLMMHSSIFYNDTNNQNTSTNINNPLIRGNQNDSSQPSNNSLLDFVRRTNTGRSNISNMRANSNTENPFFSDIPITTNRQIGNRNRNQSVNFSNINSNSNFGPVFDNLYSPEMNIQINNDSQDNNRENLNENDSNNQGAFSSFLRSAIRREERNINTINTSTNLLQNNQSPNRHNRRFSILNELQNERRRQQGADLWDNMNSEDNETNTNNIQSRRSVNDLNLFRNTEQNRTNLFEPLLIQSERGADQSPYYTVSSSSSSGSNNSDSNLLINFDNFIENIASAQNTLDENRERGQSGSFSRQPFTYLGRRRQNIRELWRQRRERRERLDNYYYAYEIDRFPTINTRRRIINDLNTKDTNNNKVS